MREELDVMSVTFDEVMFEVEDSVEFELESAGNSVVGRVRFIPGDMSVSEIVRFVPGTAVELKSEISSSTTVTLPLASIF